MPARVQWQDAQGLQGVVDLGQVEIFIGRQPECAIRTDDPMVSRRHARIYFQNGSHVIEDLGSANGVYVGEQRVQMHVMRNNDAVRCGSLWLKYSADSMVASYNNNSQPPQQPPNYGVQQPQQQQPNYGAPPAAPQPNYGAPPAAQQQPNYGAPPAAAPQPNYGAPPAAPMASQPPPAAPPPAVPMRPTVGGGQAPMASPIGGGQPAAAATPAAPKANSDDVARLQRRVDQLQTEVRMLRGGGDKAARMEDLENKSDKLTRENAELEETIKRLESRVQADEGSQRVQKASNILSQAEDVVTGLNDTLSELRINLMAAEGEVEGWVTMVPRPQFEMVREALHQCRAQMETAKELIRQLRDAGR